MALEPLVIINYLKELNFLNNKKRREYSSFLSVLKYKLKIKGGFVNEKEF